MSGDYEALVADTQRMQYALLSVRQDLQQMLDWRPRIDPSVTPFDGGLKTLVSIATDCWTGLQAALASENYYLLDAEVSRVTERMQKMAEATRSAAAAASLHRQIPNLTPCCPRRLPPTKD